MFEGNNAGITDTFLHEKIYTVCLLGIVVEFSVTVAAMQMTNFQKQKFFMSGDSITFQIY